ncbi:peptidoglycan DD-metalloendopeptidase family protein [Luteococcus sp.]|uniref:peptidoglycan DD-metalloendopeptidase family protein n=1 Tax=Luteococcus sp. TaxID=1969402 RepID=UPI0037352DA6
MHVTSNGSPELRTAPSSMLCPHPVRTALATLCALGLAVSAAPLAGADELTDQRDRIAAEQARSKQELTAFSGELNQAAAALQQSRTQLEQARAHFAQAQQQRQGAEAEDARLAKALEQARAQLRKAQQDVAENQEKVDAEARLIGNSVRETHQQNTELVGLAAFVTDVSTGDVNQKFQWSTTVFNATQAQMDRLQELQMKLEAAREEQASAEATVARQKEAAAAQVASTIAAERAADQAAAAVTDLVASNERAQAAVEDKLAAEQRRQQAWTQESSAVERRIAERIAAEKAARAAAAARARAQAAAAQKAAAEAARQRAADAAQKAAAACRAEAAASRAESETGGGGQAARFVTSGSGWIAPVAGGTTSLFGMRLHPVLKIWKLHDGLDHAAACNSPIIAPRGGVVTESYFNEGYGNRLVVDHGNVDGRFVTTSYNHATHYVVSPGQRVSKGDVLGFVGNTGYSTGCHLHLMTWSDGVLVDPASIF